MYLDFILLGLAVVSFLVAFYFVRWGGEADAPMDKPDAWKFTDTGGGGV